jgi:DNA-binding CsgD family transcriptional regulator
MIQISNYTQIIEVEHDKSQSRFIRDEAKRKLRRLTKREYQILLYTITGMPNKLISYKLSVSQRTIENHRLKIFKKTNCKTLPALLSIVVLGKNSCLPYCILKDNCLRPHSLCEMSEIFQKS